MDDADTYHEAGGEPGGEELTDVDADILTKVCKLIPRLASNHDGEVVATARAIERTLKAAKEDWHSLVSVLNGSGKSSKRALPEEPPVWEELTAGERLAWLFLLTGDFEGSPWETEFLGSILDQYRRRGRLSEKQIVYVDKILTKAFLQGLCI